MKTTICIFSYLLFFHWVSYGQNKTNISDTIKPIAVTELSINRSPELLWQKFADSINSYNKTGIFPGFLNDICLDWNAGYWPGFHSPNAVRWKILSLVKDKKSLELLVENKPEVLKTKCDRKWTYKGYPGDLTPPMNDISTYDLVIRRLTVVQN